MFVVFFFFFKELWYSSVGKYHQFIEASLRFLVASFLFLILIYIMLLCTWMKRELNDCKE